LFSSSINRRTLRFSASAKLYSSAHANVFNVLKPLQWL